MLRLVVLQITGAAALLALDPAARISQYHQRVWQVEQGLPQNFVNSIVQDRRGELLVATEGGVARFDGMSFTPFSRDARDVWWRQWITVLRWQEDGTLWAGSRRSGVYRIRDGRAENLNLGRNSQVHDILVDRNGTVWALSTSGIWKGVDGGLQRIPGLRGIDSSVWCATAETADGSVWLVTQDGLIRYRRNWSERISLPPEAGQPTSIHKGRDGRLWLGTSRGIYSVELTPNLRVRHVAHSAANVTSILDDGDGNLWLGTWGGGVYRINSFGTEHWSTQQGLPDDFVRCFFEDSEGNLWIGTRSGGMTRWKATAIVPYAASEGLGGNFASAIVSAPGKGLYLGTWRSGLAWFDGRNVRSIPLPLPSQEFLVRSLAVDRHGILWVGTWQGLFYGGRDGIERAAGDPEAQHFTAAVHFDSNGGLWLGSEFNGLLHYPAGRPDASNRKLWLRGEGVGALINSNDGSVLAATRTGVVRIAGGSVQRVINSPASAALTSALCQDQRGRVWSAAPGNVVTVSDGQSVHRFGPVHGFPQLPAMGIAEDRSGDLWISTAHGIYRIRGTEIDRLLSGSSARVETVRFGQDDGMRSGQCHGKSHPVVAMDDNGDLWFPTVRGFVKVRTDDLADTPPPRPWLQTITIAGALQPLGDVAAIPSGGGPIEIAYNAISLTSPERLQFRYRLRGYEQNWTWAGSRRTATYTRLPGGSYALEVSARHPGGGWGEPVAVAALRQQAAFRETAWFAAALAGCGGLFVGAALLLYQRLRRSRLAAVQLERQRIAREWHDTLLADFAAVSWQLEATREKISPSETDAHTSLDLARGMVRHSQTEARRLIHELRESEHDESAALDISLRRALERLNANQLVKTSLEVRGTGLQVALRQRRDILMIYQEAVANALRHSRGSQIRVLLDCSSAGLRLEVEDNGIGVTTTGFAPPPGHFGIRGMQERANNLGGRLLLESEPGQGTRVTLMVPQEALAE